MAHLPWPSGLEPSRVVQECGNRSTATTVTSSSNPRVAARPLHEPNIIGPNLEDKTMERPIAYRFLTCAACLVLVGMSRQNLSAQDVAITNARVIVGNGTVINAGTVIVRGGKIASVSAGAANTQGLKTIDAKGMRAMPGFIDAHRHLNTGPTYKAAIQA